MFRVSRYNADKMLQELNSHLYHLAYGTTALLPIIRPEITHPIDNIDDLLMFYVHKFKIISENYGKDCQLFFKIQYFFFFNKRTSEFYLSTSLSRTKTTFSSFCLVFQLGGHVTEFSPKGVSENYWHYFQLMPLKWLVCVCVLCFPFSFLYCWNVDSMAGAETVILDIKMKVTC